MTENICTRVKHYMKSQNFSVNDFWLRECIEYFISTHPEARAEAVQKFVQEQFLLTDLREINDDKGCLPPNLTQQKNTTLNGKYTLQLLYLYDISVSKFKQLEKIRNVSIDNIIATKEENSQNWEPTGKRMLQLFLTDGKQDILAIEYKPIRVLNDSLFPGLKLMLIGPVVCRRGVILLEETNICLKGGEVDDLLIPNAVENVLAKKLNLTINPDPYNDTKVKKKEILNDLDDDFNFDLEEIEKIERSQELIENVRPLNSNTNSLQSTVNSNSNFSSNTNSDSNLKTNTSSNLKSNSTSNRNCNEKSEVPRSNQIQGNIDEFPTDEDFEDFDLEELVLPTKSSNNNENLSKAAIESIPYRSFDQPKPTSSNLPQFPSDDFGDDFDLDDVDFESEEAWSEPMELPKKLHNSEPASSFRNDSGFSKSNLEVTTGSKRTAGDLSPLSASNSKVRCAQSTPKISKINRKITDFVNNAPPKEKLPPKICDYISDVLTQSLTDQPIRKTVRGKVSQIGKLTKKNLLWILDGTIADETGSIDVEFSSEFLEKIVGMSVSEFSQKKKKIKTDPKLEEQLRKQMLDGQNKLQSMDSLMELELKDKKPVVLSSRELTQGQKNDYDKRFRMLKSEIT